MLDDPAKREASQNACLNIARSAIGPDLARKIREFVNDHHTPARFENAGTQLSRKQEVLQNSLQRILQKASLGQDHEDAATVSVMSRPAQEERRPLDPVVSGFQQDPAPMGMSNDMNDTNGSNMFHNLRAMGPLNTRATPSGEQRMSQLEQVYEWAGPEAVR